MIWQGYKYLGIMTNNEAEYNAILFLISAAKSKNISTLEICGDSALVINQLNGEWKIKEPRIKALTDIVKEVSKEMSITYTWIPRKENSLADKLSNTAVVTKGEMF
jgi:ribonuclease HI